MDGHLLGLTLAVGALVLWSFSPFFFTAAGRRIGPFPTNLLRLAFAFLLLLIILGLRSYAAPESFGLPAAAPWLWLAASGAIGLALGDFFLYRSLVFEGPERTSLFMTLAPAATAVMAWLGLRELLTGRQLTGMALVLAGVSLATWKRVPGKSAIGPATRTAFLLSGPMTGIWAALCQGLGTVLARQAFLAEPELDPIMATTIRIGAGAVTLWAWARMLGRLGPLLGDWTRPAVMGMLAGGTLAGPVLGMLCFVGALKYTAAGVVTTITFMSPLLVLPLGAWHYGTRLGLKAVLGTLISLAGVVLLGWM